MPVEYGAELPPYLANLAEQVVTNGYGQFVTYANNALAGANSAFNELAAFDVQQIPTTINFNVTADPGTFVAPPAPTRTIPTYNVTGGLASVDFEAPEIHDTARTPPPEPEIDYEYQIPADKPGAHGLEFPDTNVVLDTVIVPEEPDLPTVGLPALYTLPDLPLEPEIAEIEFEGEPPAVDFDVPPQTFSFTETPYTSDLVDLIKTKITLMAEGTGLTPEQELASFERARAREDQIAFRALQEEDEKFASRGFTMPNGILAKQRRIVQQAHQSASLDHSRKVELDNKLLMIDSLKFAIAQGIACEQMLLTAHLAIEERRFQTARFAYEALLSTFNARIALFNARVQLYQADAQVYRDRIQAELAKVEVYKARIDGLRMIGEVNKVLVEQYEAEVRATMILVERYKVSVEAAEAVSRVNISRIEAVRLRVQAYAEGIKAWGIEWDAYKAQVDAERGKLEAGDIAARIYATHVNAWSTKRNADFERARIETAIEGMKLQKYDGDVKEFLARVEGERTRVQTAAAALSADAQVYAAAGQIAQAESAALDRVYQADVQRATTAAQLLLRNGEIIINQALQVSAQLLEAKRSLAQVSSQLAASAMSAINISGSINATASGGMAFSNSVNYNYSGDA